MDNQTLQQLASPGNVVTPEEYGRNRAQIQAAKAFLERLETENETGRAKYEAELLQKVREGEEARQRLLDLERHRNSRTKNRSLAIEAPSTARIEELPPATTPQSPSQWTAGSAPSQAVPQRSLHFAAPPTQSTTRPFYNGNIQQPLQNQSYSGPQFRHYHVPHPQFQAVNPPERAHQGQQPVYYHQMPTPNQQVNGLQRPAGQHQPSVTRLPKPSSNLQSQGHVHGSSAVSQVPISSVKNKNQDFVRPVHYTPTGVQAVGTSSLTGALGPQASRSTQPSTPLDPLPATSPSAPPIVPSAAQVAPLNPQLPESPSVAQLSDSESSDRKSKILTFRSSVLEWAKTSQPNSFTEFFKIKVYKAPNSNLYITSLYQGKEVTEPEYEFFKRLWVIAGLSPDSMPFEQTFTTGPSPSDRITAGHSIPIAPPTASTPTQYVVTQQGAGSSSASAKLPTRIPQTPQQRTLVDSGSGTWRSPADADKKRLARDLINALGKRKQDLVTQSSPNENPAKRQALEAPSTSRNVHRTSEQGIQTSTTTSTTSPTLQVTSQPEASKPVTITEPSNRVQEPVTSTSAEPAEPAQHTEPSLPLTIVTLSAIPHSQPDPTLLQNNISASNQSHSFPTSSASLHKGQTNGTPDQVVLQSGSLPSELATLTPSKTSSPASTSRTLIPYTEKFGPAISVSQLPASVSSTAIGDVASVPQVNEEVNQSCGSNKLVAEDSNPSAGAEVKPHSPPSSQVIRNEEPAVSLSKSNEDWPSALNLSEGASTSTARQPLFLPSPSPSSSPLPSKKINRLSSVYVLVPPPPKYLIRYRSRQSMKDELDSQKDSSRTSSFVSTSRTSRSLEDFALPLESERDIDPHEQEAVRLSCSRLQPLTCRWGECGLALNSVDALVRHLNREHKPAGISFICRWTQCGRQCRSHEKHLERHARMTLQCAYQGCTESYRTGSQLLKHFRAKHLNGVLKAQAKAFHYKSQPPVPLPNAILPSYLIVTTPVVPTPISPDQRSILEPWVLHNVAGFDGDRPKVAKKSNGSGSTGEARKTYEFLNMRSTRYSWIQSKPVDMDFADLDSEEISKECDNGLTFFGTEDSGVEDVSPSDEEGPPPSSFPSTPPKINGDANDTERASSEGLDWRTTQTVPSDDEKMVEMLLVIE